MPDREARIVVFGDVIDDVIVTPAAPIRTDTDTPASIERRAGGSAANVAAWLASSGGKVDFVGRVGVVDIERHSMLLTDAGVRPMLSADHTLPTGTIVIIVEGEQRTMLTERGANAAHDPASVSDAVLDGAAVLHFTGYSLFGHEDLAGFRKLIRHARARGVEVSVDPGSAGFLQDFGPAKFLKAIEGATILFPSLEEGRVLTGLDEPIEIAQKLSRTFPVVALTSGASGVIVATQGSEPIVLHAGRAVATDPTGAGDAFCAGFLGAWIQSANAQDAALAGMRLAIRAITVVGGRPPV